MNASQIIQALGLQPLEPEGGYFAQTFKSPSMTAIFYLITSTDFSRFHRLKNTEVYHFYAGTPAELHLLSPEGTLKTVVLGNMDFEHQTPQFVVPANTWQALKIRKGIADSWALLGATVSPGFEYEDFEIARREDLLRQFPQHHAIINELSRD